MRSVLLAVPLLMLMPVIGAAQSAPGAPETRAPVAGDAGATSTPQTPRGSEATQSPRTARIRGRVVRADTGEPLRRAEVRAQGPEPYAALTDDEGRYEIAQLPAGRFHLSAARGGYAEMQYGQRRHFRAGQPLTLANGQVLEKIDFALSPGGVIAGRIVDEAGEIVIGADVIVLRPGYASGKRQLMQTGGDRTDDRGEFRIFGLAPAEYYVAARVALPSELSGRVGYAPTYYPGTPSVSEAQRVTLAAGQELSDVVFAMAPTRTASISGVVRTSDGIPPSLAMAIVTQAPGDAPAQMAQSAFGVVRPDGSFVVGNISPGAYVVSVRSADRTTMQAGTTEVVVNGRDVSGIVLEMRKSAAARGRIRFDTATPPPDVAPGQIRIFPTSAERSDLSFSNGSMPEPARDDWTFEVTGLGGRQFLRAGALRENSWTLKSVRIEGVDVTDTPIDFRLGDIDGIEVMLTRQLTELSGAVTDGRGTSITNATVVAFADNPEKWIWNTRFIQSAKVDQDGRFRLRGLPPENYVVVALDDLEPGEETDPEVLAQLRTSGTRVTLRDGETRTLDVQVTAY